MERDGGAGKRGRWESVRNEWALGCRLGYRNEGVKQRTLLPKMGEFNVHTVGTQCKVSCSSTTLLQTLFLRINIYFQLEPKGGAVSHETHWLCLERHIMYIKVGKVTFISI